MNLLATFQFYEDNANEWRWRIRGRNGEIIAASSEGFHQETYARNNLKSLLRFCLPADIKVASEDPENSRRPLSFYEDNAGEWRWRITAANGHITHASSEGFASKRSAINNLTLVEETVREWVSHN